MLKKTTYLIVLASLAFGAAGQQSFDEKLTTSSNVRLTVTNIGTFGNAGRGYRDGSGQPSLEYPAGSGIEHLFEGGLWIGVQPPGGGNGVVSTSAYDAPQGYAPGRQGFEFAAPVGSQLIERSSLFDSRYYDPKAVSHQDYVAEFSDRFQEIPGTNIQITNHTPLNLGVHMETYNWNYTFSDFMVIVNFTITNNSQNTYEDVYVGLWNNTVVRNINITPFGSGGAAFFNKGGNGYMDSLNMAYCFDAEGDPGFTNSYIGQKFLGASDKFGFHHPELDSTYNEVTGNWVQEDLEVNYNAWQFNTTANPVFFFPTTDDQRYLKMSDGLNHSPCWEANNPNCLTGRNYQQELEQAGNRSDIVSAGPFQSLAPGESINVAFAYVLAKKYDDGNPTAANTPAQRQILIDHATWAQQAFNGEDQNFNGVLDEGEDLDNNDRITRYILPSPPEIPRTTVVPTDNKIEIYWADNSRNSVDPISNQKDFEGYRVYLSKLGFDVEGTSNLARDFKLVAEFDIAGNGLFKETGFEKVRLDEPKYFEGDTTAYVYKYTIDNLPDGWQYAVAVTAFDRGSEESNLESLESSFLANQYRAFPGTTPNENMDADEPFVYPNPYYYGAAWEGASNFQEESRKIIFANLPRRCEVRIFTVAGDFIDSFHHDENYKGDDIRWFQTFGAEDTDNNVFSGGQHAWDLLSLDSQIISRGLYMFSVEDLDTGEKYTGKFVIIK